MFIHLGLFLPYSFGSFYSDDHFDSTFYLDGHEECTESYTCTVHEAS